MKKKAIIVVSFGSTHADTREKTIDQIEASIERAFPAYRIYRAYTSKMILQILKKRDGITIPTVCEALQNMIGDGIEEVIVQPTHIVDGIENEQMKEDVMSFEKAFQSLHIGEPLLSSKEDYEQVVYALMNDFKIGEDETLVLMGHGTSHVNNKCYETLEETFVQAGHANVLIGTVEAKPEIKDLLPKLREKGIKSIQLAPFMVVAGDHAKNDMAGEEEDSWKNILRKEGFLVHCHVKGIGENPLIQELYCAHIRDALEEIR